MELLIKTQKSKQNLEDNHFHNTLRRFDVLLNFRYTTKETSAHISNKHGIYKMPHELLNDLRQSILGS